MRETEVKVEVSDPGELELLAQENGYVLGPPRRQVDHIFARDIGDILYPTAGVVVLRLRYEADTVRLTAKQDISSELDCVEYETIVNDGRAMEDILCMQGYHPVVTVSKTRKSAKRGRFSLCLDQVDNLGCFAELELLGDASSDHDGLEHELLLELQSLTRPGSRRVTVGYDRLLLEWSDL